MLGPRFLPEARSVDDHDMFLADEFLHEDFVALGNIDARIGIECPARRHATDARRRLTPLLSQVAPRAQFPSNPHQMILRSFQSRLDRVLLGVIGAETSPQQTVYPLGVSLYRRCFSGDDAPANAPAG